MTRSDVEEETAVSDAGVPARAGRSREEPLGWREGQFESFSRALNSGDLCVEKSVVHKVESGMRLRVC